MNETESIIGLIIVVLFVLLVIFFSIKKIRTKYPPAFRKIPGITKLRRALGLAVEDGTRVHVSLGSSSIIEPTNTSALIGLSTLHRVGQLTSTSDLPPVTTSGSAGLHLLSQDVLKQISIETNTREMFDPTYAQFTGVSPFSYAVGTMESINDTGINANIYIGNFGGEAGLLCDAAEEKKIYTLASSDSMVSQSIFYALANDTLIGEELYALPAYLAYHHSHQASLRVQDLFRFITGTALVIGSLLTLFGLL